MVNLLMRLGASNTSALLASNGSETSFRNEVSMEIDSQSDYTPLSVAEELDKAIKDGYAPMQPVRFETLASKIQKERYGDYLERIYPYLMTIKPTSVESEQAFSSAGNFVVKIRSRLNDETVDELCFLKVHFQKHNK